MRPSLWRSPALLLVAATSAVQVMYQDEVGDIDYHHELIGLPQIETTLFHRPRRDDKASLLYTLSDSLTGNITNGGGHLRAAEGENWIVTAYGHSVQAWNALSGRSAWWLDFTGHVKDLEVMELTENDRKDVLALFEEDNGATTLRRLNGQTGAVVSTNIEKIFVVSLYGTLTSYGLRVSVLDIHTGKRVNEILLGTKGDVDSKDDIMFVGANSASPIVAWADKGRSKLYVNVLGTKKKHDRTPTANKADVYHIDLKTSAVTKAYELPLLPGVGAFSTSSQGANVWFTRITDDEVILTSSESHAILGRWPYKPNTESSQVIHGVSEVIRKPDDSYAVRAAALTRSDDWVLVRNGDLAWSRPEGLTGAVAAAFAEFPENVQYAKVLEEEAHSNVVSAYVHRVQRHLKDLEQLPDWLASIPQRLISSITGSDAPVKKDGLHRDSFGFNKLAILATRRGRVYGLDIGNHGKVAWSSAAFAIPSGQTWDVKGIFVEDHRGLVTIRGSNGEQVVAKTTTGEIIEVLPEGAWPKVEATAIVDSASGQWLLPIGVDGKVGDVPAEWTPEQTVVVRSTDGGLKGLTWSGVEGSAKEVVSWTFLPPGGQTIVEVATRASHDPVAQIGRVLGDRKVKYKYLNPNTAVVAATSAATSTLTIYLLDTVSGQILSSKTYEGVDASKTIDCAVAENWYACTFFGQYALKDAQGHALSGQSLKGYQIVVTDLYESNESNDRGPLGSAANFSSIETVDEPTGAPTPFLVSQAWVLSAPIVALAVTQTRQGITNRQLLGYQPETHGIAGLPRQVITHQRDVIGVKDIIATPALLESTTLVFAYGIDIFGTRLAPSLSFDILGKGFDKVTLIGTVLALVAGVAALKPIVRRKQTDLRWTAPR
ncbi:ER membrane protein complex subunit 1 like [Verticillium longisporum]|nr:ER membrane protein complex subunit 1 like [Verticillium longisporum]